MADSAPSNSPIATLAERTRTPPEVVRDLYDQEVAALGASAKVRNFIPIIAGRRVKQRLTTLKNNRDISKASF